jgi:replicative DNA helicase
MEKRTPQKSFHYAPKEPEKSILGKVPPQALELEVAVLGAMMLERDALQQVVDILAPEDFYDASHKDIYQAIIDLYRDSSPVDMRTVVNQLRKNGTLEKVGNSFRIAEITSLVSSAANIEYHARYVAEMSMKRKLIIASSEVQTLCYEDTSDPFELLDGVQATIDGITVKHIRRTAEPAAKVYEASIEQHQAARAMKGLVGVPSGYTTLDRLTGGWKEPDLIIIAARPSMGKSAVAGAIVRNAAIDFKKPVALFSLEMSSKQFMDRMISSESEVDLEKIIHGTTNDQEFAVMMQKGGRISSAPIFIDDTAAITIMELRAKCRRLKAEHNIELIVVDYLQLMRGDDSGNREQEIASISRGLKVIAKELKIPVIALSQLSRAVETRGGEKRPQLSDLRESGAIEQDADMVIFLYRAEYYKIYEYEDGTSSLGIMEVIVAKSRNGACDSVRLRFIGRYCKIMDFDQPMVQVNPPPMRSVEISYRDRQVGGRDQHGKDDDVAF